jgi:epoxyqueuosine reductase
MALEQDIKSQANRLGFQLAGFTTPNTPPHVGVFESWLAAGRYGEMGYLASDHSRRFRANPLLILSECRSILVLGVRYPAPTKKSVGCPDTHLFIRDVRGRLASYAGGSDYHTNLPLRMKQLVQWIETRLKVPVPHRWYTDTGPILERDLAQRAGLGWIGKNTCLINPSMGSYFFLAEILLGVDLEPDLPFTADYCGSCTRCQEVCPTSCILPDRTLESSRCISYLTIELKSAIPADLRSKLGDWVFGCDICQQVCPWNQRFATPEGDPAFAPLSDLSNPFLLQEVALSPQAFNRKYKHSPVKRAKRAGYLRNVVVALANLAVVHPELIPDALESLKQVLFQEPEALVRGHAAWGLGQMDHPKARLALSLALQHVTDPYVLKEIESAL